MGWVRSTKSSGVDVEGQSTSPMRFGTKRRWVQKKQEDIVFQAANSRLVELAKGYCGYKKLG